MSATLFDFDNEPRNSKSNSDTHAAPDLIDLTRRLSECPEVFLDACCGPESVRRVIALIADHFRDHAQASFPKSLEPLFRQLAKAPSDHTSERYLQMLAIVTWILHAPYFLNRADLIERSVSLVMDNHLRQLAILVNPRQLVADPDRREELVRFCLDRLGLIPHGESATQAADRLTSLNSLERQRILQETVEAEKRAREVREAMAKRQALESASRYGE